MKYNRTIRFGVYFFAFSALVIIISIFSSSFAEFYSTTVSAFVRYILSALTGFYSFSLAEIIILLLPAALLIFLCLFIVSFFAKRQMFRSFCRIALCFILVLLSVFINTFAVCYFRKPVEQSMDLQKKALTREQMYLSTDFIKQELEASLDDITFNKDGSSQNVYDWEELDRLIDKGFNLLRQDYGFVSDIVSKPKKILLSNLMTYTHISGVYFPFTGEANINTNYPDYVVAFTVGHEKAHQRGIASEDEANFVAFLALLYSGDEYLRYSALMNMYDYYLDSIYSVDVQMYEYFIQNSHDSILGEMYAYSDFFDKYRNSAASKVADSVNDTYIKAMGDNSGVNSYGKVVELVSAYMHKNNGLPS